MSYIIYVLYIIYVFRVNIYIYIYIYIYNIYIYIYDHFELIDRSHLTLSRHPFLSSIAPGMSPRVHPVSAQN